KLFFTTTFTESPTVGLGGSTEIWAAAAIPAWIAPLASSANAKVTDERMFGPPHPRSRVRPTCANPRARAAVPYIAFSRHRERVGHARGIAVAIRSPRRPERPGDP